MRIRIVKEGFKDDAEADKKIEALVKTGAFQSLVSSVSTSKDFSRAVESFIKALKEKRPQLAKSVDADSNLKQVNVRLNQTQGEKTQTTNNQQPTQQ